MEAVYLSHPDVWKSEKLHVTPTEYAKHDPVCLIKREFRSSVVKKFKDKIITYPKPSV